MRVGACGEIVVRAVELRVGGFFQLSHIVQVIVQRVEGDLTSMGRGYVGMHAGMRVHVITLSLGLCLCTCTYLECRHMNREAKLVRRIKIVAMQWHLVHVCGEVVPCVCCAARYQHHRATESPSPLIGG